MNYYKYQPVYDHKALASERSIENLVTARAIFSKRTNFNDLFDSQVDLVVPKKNELRNLCNELKGKEKRIFIGRYMGGKGKKTFEELDSRINEILDDYYFYCVSGAVDSNLMWSHYASSHSGFCIEWSSEDIKAEEVKYKHKIASVNLIELIRYNLKLDDGGKLKRRLWMSLRTKLVEWEYENEYRVHLGNDMEHLIVKNLGQCVLVDAKPEWIKSVIFGCRMPQATRKYIVSKMSKNTKFKEAKIGKNRSGIVIKNVA